MLDASAIEAISRAASIEAAHEALSAALATRGQVALPGTFSVHDLENALPQRRRLRGSMTTQALPDFAAYTEAHKQTGATCFVDGDAMAATAVLNLGAPAEPGHADNLAHYQPRATACYRSLEPLQRGTLSQRTVAEWLEDWHGYWSAAHDGDPMTFAEAVAAVRNVTVEALRRAESGVGQLSTTGSTFEQIKASSGNGNKLPTHIAVTCAPYLGFLARKFVLRVGVRGTSDKGEMGGLTLQLISKELHQEEMAQELAALVSGALAGSGVPVHVGAYKRGA